MKKAWVISLFAVLASLPALGQTAAFNGNCTEGGIPSLTSGLPSSNRLLGVIPHCTVSVYLTGTTTLATIYSDANNTTLTNPFTATPVYLPNSGSWLFYAATGQGYDVVMSGGDTPLTYTSPVTLTDLIIESGGGGSSFTASVNGTPLIVSGSANLINSPSITVTNPSTNQIQFTAVNQGPTVEVNGTPIAPSSPANFVDNSTVTWDFTSGAIHANIVPVPPPTPLSIQHNDSTTGVSQTVLDFNDTTPAPPSGNESVTFQTDVGTGRLSGYVPIPTSSFQMHVPNPSSVTTWIDIYPSTVTIIPGSPPNSAAADLTSAFLANSACGISGPYPPCGSYYTVNWTFTLPSYINPSNVTQVNGSAIAAVSGAFPLGFNATAETTCKVGVGSPVVIVLGNSNSGNQFPLTYFTDNLTATGAQIPTVTCTASITAASMAFQSGLIMSMPAILLQVADTIDTPPANTAIEVNPPLTYGATGLGFDTTYPVAGQYLQGYTVAQALATLPSPTPGNTYQILDSTVTTGCAVGGGSNIVLTYWTGAGGCFEIQGGGVTSINSTAGAFTFSFSAGAGSCSGTTCTFTGSGSGGGSVTNFISGDLSPLFTTSVATSTTTPTLSFSLSNAAQNSVFAGPPSGGSGAPSYQTAPVFSAANLVSFPTLNQNTTGNAATATTATSLAGGGVGSLPYQSAANTTVFIASPTTSGHVFIPAWQPSGSAIAPTAIDLGTYLGTNITGTSPIVATPSTLGVALSCPTCGSSSGGTAVTVNGGSALASLNINSSAPLPDAGYQALPAKISGASMIIEASIASLGYSPFIVANQAGADFCAKLAAALAAANTLYGSYKGTFDARGFSIAQTCSANPFTSLPSSGEAGALVLMPPVHVTTNATWATSANDVVIRCTADGGSSGLFAGSSLTTNPILSFGSGSNTSQAGNERVESCRLDANSNVTGTVVKFTNTGEGSGLVQSQIVGGNSSGATSDAVSCVNCNNMYFQDDTILTAGANNGISFTFNGGIDGNPQEGNVLVRMTCNNTTANNGLACINFGTSANQAWTTLIGTHSEGFVNAINIASGNSINVFGVDSTGTVTTTTVNVASGAQFDSSMIRDNGTATNLLIDSNIPRTFTAAANTFAGHALLNSYKSKGAITGGTIDGTVIGASVAAAGTFTTVTATGLGGSTQCVESIAGVLTGTGSACGAVGTSVTVNGGSVLSTLNINATAPIADANNLALTPKISGSNLIIEVPFGSASGFGVLECGTGLSCTGGVASTTSSISGMTTGQVAIAGSATTITSSIALGNSGSDIPQLSSGLLNASVIPNNAANTTGFAAGIAGGAVGSLPYQSAANTTLFIASPTTSGHAFVPMWTPSGSAIAPTAVDLGTYLGSNITASSPIVATPSTLGTQLSCPTCGTAGGGTSLGVNGGGTLGSANLNAISPVADANYLALLPKISAADIIIEVPYGSASGFGVLECGTGTSCTSGVISTTSSISGMTTGQLSVAGSATTITSSIAIGNTGSDIPQLSGGLLNAAVIPNNAANTSGNAAAIAGGALGSLPYQSAASTTLFVAGSTTSGHTFVLAERPTGSLIAPVLMDLGTYLGTNVTASTPLVATPTTLGVAFSCPTCSTGTAPGGSTGQIQWNSSGSFAGLTVSGDGTLVTSTGVLTVTKSGGVAFGSAAFQPASSFQPTLGYVPAHSGANSDITSISGLTTPLSSLQGGTGNNGGGTGYAFGNGLSPFTYSTTIPGSAVSGNIPGNAANLSGTPTLPNGTAATTQTTGDATTKLATDQFVATAVANTAVKVCPAGTITLTGGSPILSGAKAVFTATCTGLLATDNIMLDFNADPTAVTGFIPSSNGMLTIIKFPTANTINVYEVNNTASSVTPGTVVLNFRVVR